MIINPVNATGQPIQYYKINDFYNSQSTQTLTILPHFKTHQQETPYTCGAAAALMVAQYSGVQNYNEKMIADMMQIKEPIGKEKGIYGTSTKQLANFFINLGFEVQSSMDNGGISFQNPYEFRNWTIAHLNNNTPIMVEWIDWGGHWQIIIGYDTMGTETIEDDVVIFADSFNTSGHCHGGYYVFGAERFYEMWFDAKYFNDNESEQQWVIARKNDSRKENSHVYGQPKPK